MANPLSVPGPEYDSAESRLAFLYDALNTYGRFRLTHILFTCSATVRQSSAASATHGPAIKKNSPAAIRFRESSDMAPNIGGQKLDVSRGIWRESEGGRGRYN